MKKFFLPYAVCPAVSVAACVLFWSVGASAQTVQLNPASARISDAAIQADMDSYKQMQRRIQKLNEGGVLLRSYHLSKAQCWLDVSLHEYTRNDRSAFPQEALSESEKLIVGMERKTASMSMETQLVNNAAVLRPDLWARAKDLKAHAGFACAQQKTACAEVELVHAGNEFNQQGWRHAQPYVQIAEDQLGEAEQLAKACVTPVAAIAPVPAPTAVPPPAPVVVPVPAQTAPVPTPARVELTAIAVFSFDRFGVADMRAFSTDSLKAMVDQTQGGKIKIEQIRLTGHADRLNNTGTRDYNQQLSRKRAETVRQFLVSAGLPAAAMTFEYLGDSQQVAQCTGKFKSKAELQECLLPNRRVEVKLLGVRTP